METILQQMPPARQTMLFSATLPNWVAKVRRRAAALPPRPLRCRRACCVRGDAHASVAARRRSHARQQRTPPASPLTMCLPARPPARLLGVQGCTALPVEPADGGPGGRGADGQAERGRHTQRHAGGRGDNKRGRGRGRLAASHGAAAGPRACLHFSLCSQSVSLPCVRSISFGLTPLTLSLPATPRHPRWSGARRSRRSWTCCLSTPPAARPSCSPRPSWAPTRSPPPSASSSRARRCTATSHRCARARACGGAVCMR